MAPAENPTESENRGRSRRRTPRVTPARTVMVFPTRDGDHIVVTLTIGKYELSADFENQIILLILFRNNPMEICFRRF